MKKIFLVIIILFIFILLLFSFDFNSYQPITFDGLKDFMKKDIKDNKNFPGQTQFGEKFRIIIKLKEYPTLIDPKKDKITIKSLPVSIFDGEILDMFTYKMSYTYKNQKYIFLFQDNLMKYLPKEIKLGESVELFIVLGIHDNINNEVTILVNEFNTNRDFFGKLIPEENKDAKVYFKNAFIKIKAKDYEGAIKDFDKAIELDPNYVSAYYNRGIVKYNLEDYNGSIKDLTKTIELEPNNPNIRDTYFYRGLANYFISDKKGACEDWIKSKKHGHPEANDLIIKYCR